jgi:prefoldin beta subunit
MELYKQYEFIMKENECIEKEQSKIRVAISNYENKKAENNIVKNELTLLDDSDIVYKLIGPILVQQETGDAKIQVDSRIEMINKEIHKLEKNYQNNFKKIDENRKKIADIQGKLIQLSKQMEQIKKKEKINI